MDGAWLVCVKHTLDHSCVSTETTTACRLPVSVGRDHGAFYSHYATATACRWEAGGPRERHLVKDGVTDDQAVTDTCGAQDRRHADKPPSCLPAVPRDVGPWPA